LTVTLSRQNGKQHTRVQFLSLRPVKSGQHMHGQQNRAVQFDSAPQEQGSSAFDSIERRHDSASVGSHSKAKHRFSGTPRHGTTAHTDMSPLHSRENSGWWKSAV
jgi:hypothetical protein